jgi:SAM-dependent methyltransferase
LDILAAPGGGAHLLVDGDNLSTADGSRVARIVDGVVCCSIRTDDPSIEFYRAAGGAQFHERSKVTYAMTTLDTPVYHKYLDRIRPADRDAVIADIGGGDGRNAIPWLASGQKRIVVVDPVLDALRRFRHRVANDHPEWLPNLLLIEGDARSMPIRSETCHSVQAIESLYYLNEDYRLGLLECCRITATGGSILLSDRDYEGALLMRLFYFGGVNGMLSQVGSRDVWDGDRDHLVRSRCFTPHEHRKIAESCQLRVIEELGISSLSLVLSYLRGEGKITQEDEVHISQVRDLLISLGESGQMRRANILICRKD